MLTIEDAQTWAAERYKELESDRLAHPDKDIQIMNRMMPAKSRELWNSGCWLTSVLRAHGANDEQVSSIQFAAGQRAFGGSAWQSAVDYANEFITTGDTKEKGGLDLAIKRNNELFGE